ncbi:MAG: hypothetical protein WAM61_18680 [Desulfobacterales bacterium]
MALPEVAQARALNELSASAINQYSPASLAVPGCTTGNGFEHIDISQTKRVVAIDINPDYLDSRTGLGQRFPAFKLSKPILPIRGSGLNRFRWFSPHSFSSI